MCQPVSQVRSESTFANSAFSRENKNFVFHWREAHSDFFDRWNATTKSQICSIYNSCKFSEVKRRHTSEVWRCQGRLCSSSFFNFPNFVTWIGQLRLRRSTYLLVWASLTRRNFPRVIASGAWTFCRRKRFACNSRPEPFIQRSEIGQGSVLVVNRRHQSNGHKTVTVFCLSGNTKLSEKRRKLQYRTIHPLGVVVNWTQNRGKLLGLLLSPRVKE